ncbi:MAG: GTP-binding protein [Candidatus Lokiarchaeota archaeon]|nr:GTP-binding protein [Candidatus Lokiarchaeota archaeon]
MNEFKEFLSNSIDVDKFRKFDEKVDLIQNNLPPIISIVGFGGVGKSSIANLIRTEKIPITCASEFSANIAKLKIGRINFLIRDFTGEEEIGFLWNNFIKSSDAVLIVTDSTSENVEKSRFFLKKIEEETPYASRIAIGNKGQLQNSLNSDQIEKIFGLKCYSINANNPENRDKLIQIIIDTLEMHDEISPILKVIKQQESLLNEFETALMMVNIERADSIYTKILEICRDLGENPFEMEFHNKYQEILNKLKRVENTQEPIIQVTLKKEQERELQSISSLESQLKALLLNFINDLEGIFGAIVSDREGFVITSESKKDPGDESVLGAIAVTIDTYIERIKKEFGSESSFFNITNIQDKKFAYCSMGSKSILLTISNLSTSDTELRIYSEHVASKIELLLEGSRNVSLEIPEIVKILSKTKDGKIPRGEFSFKMIITGDFSVGKTSLIRRFVQNLFKEDYHSTIGIDISQIVVDLSENTKINFIIWDIGGQIPKMAPYRKRFYEGAIFAFIVIDLTRLDCLKSVDKWYDEITKSIDMDINIVLIGNKSDLTEKLIITEKEIERIAIKYNFHYMITSAKTGENVNEAFFYLAYRFLENI